MLTHNKFIDFLSIIIAFRTSKILICNLIGLKKKYFISKGKQLFRCSCICMLHWISEIMVSYKIQVNRLENAILSLLMWSPSDHHSTEVGNGVVYQNRTNKDRIMCHSTPDIREIREQFYYIRTPSNTTFRWILHFGTWILSPCCWMVEQKTCPTHPPRHSNDSGDRWESILSQQPSADIFWNSHAWKRSAYWRRSFPRAGQPFLLIAEGKGARPGGKMTGIRQKQFCLISLG